MGPLALEGWMEFNRIKWGVQPRRTTIHSQGGEFPAVEMVYYLNKSGTIWFPPRNPYSALTFRSTSTQSISRINRQWLEVAALAAEAMRGSGIGNTWVLPPQVQDVRPWQWAGFRVNVRYTYFVDFPLQLDAVDNSIRTDLRRAQSLGFSCERSDRLPDVVDCLSDTEVRQGFRHGLTADDLGLLRQLLPTDAFRCYVTYAPEGEPASACIVLFQSGERSLYWLAGTKSRFLNGRATQLMIKTVMDDLSQQGSIGLDLVGANIPSVAYSKANWGGRLVPYYTLEAPGWRTAAKSLLFWWQFSKLQRRG